MHLLPKTGKASSLGLPSCSDIAVEGGEREITVKQQGLMVSSFDLKQTQAKQMTRVN